MFILTGDSRNCMKSVIFPIANDIKENKIIKEWSKSHEIIPLLNITENKENNLNL